MKMFKNSVLAMQVNLVNAGAKAVVKAKQAMADDRGGVSPLVVTIGLALLLLGVIIAFSGTLRSAISDAISNVISKLNSLN